MNINKKIDTIKEIYNRLLDAESKMIFEKRFEYVFDRNYDKLVNELWNIIKDKQQRSPQLEKFFEDKSRTNVILMGAGMYGRRAKEVLEKLGIKPQFYCDNDTQKVGTYIDGIEVISVDEVCQNYREYVVIPVSMVYRKDLYDQLINSFFPQENIFYPRGGVITTNCGLQYFDFEKFVPTEKDVFIDAGAYDGNTVMDFLGWCNNKYSKIYCFEPNVHNYKNVVKKIENLKNVVIVNQGTWNEEGVLSFHNDGAASKITEENAGCTIQVTTIDNTLKDEDVTFIKMDVEGAERESIEGARNIIIKNKPNLAICIYHKWLDFIEIPEAILKLVPEYKFAIRHYTNNTNETILYAWVE